MSLIIVRLILRIQSYLDVPYNIAYVIVKRGIKFVDAFAILILINVLSKIFQGFFIYKITNTGFGNFTHLFLYSLIFHFLLLVIYDYVKKDFFEIEEIKKNKDEIPKEHNALVPWIEEIRNSINNLPWVIKIRDFFNRVTWIKSLMLFLTFCTSDPSVVVIWYRKGFYKWNYFSDWKVFFYFVLACLICTFSVFLILSGVVAVI